MKLKSKFQPLEGILKVQAIYADGRVETLFEELNLIMLSSKQYMLSSIYLPSGTFDPIVNLQVGVGGTVDPDGMYPKPVTQDLTSLYTPLLTTPISYTVNSNVPSVTYIADLDQGSGNGALITEAGLFRNAGSMFNMKTFPAIPKTVEFALHFEWTIKVA